MHALQYDTEDLAKTEPLWIEDVSDYFARLWHHIVTRCYAAKVYTMALCLSVPYVFVSVTSRYSKIITIVGGVLRFIGSRMQSLVLRQQWHNNQLQLSVWLSPQPDVCLPSARWFNVRSTLKSCRLSDVSSVLTGNVESVLFVWLCGDRLEPCGEVLWTGTVAVWSGWWHKPSVHRLVSQLLL